MLNIQGGQTRPYDNDDFSNLLHQTLGLSTITCIFAKNKGLWNTFGLL